MRSPLEAISGKYEHAIFATYALNLRFVEQWILPLLRASGVRNTIILVDEAQLGEALADHNIRSLGRAYHAVAVRIGPGAFHPKLMLLNGEDGVRACVSSANLTVDGQLRNVESAYILDSAQADHRRPLAELGEFLRRVIVTAAPEHTAEAALAALPAVTDETPETNIRFLHNLDVPLVTHFPRGDLTVVSPYADGGDAAAALSERGHVRLITDGAAFAAPEAFFTNAWSVEPRDFEKRRLHGKAYWTTSQTSWLLLGSPNLSRQALLATASQANTEAALAITPNDPPLADPPGLLWNKEPLRETAPNRFTAVREASVSAESAGSFNAWEDETVIRVAGVEDGTTSDYWIDGAWHSLGVVTAGALVPPLDLRPYLIRAKTGKTFRLAVVHRPDQLRIQRLKPRGTSRAADVISTLPLDIAGVQALESVLKDLYLLAALHTGEPSPSPALSPTKHETSEGISDWVPARPDDDPRIPDIYRRQWQNAPDALLALIRNALRLDATSLAEERAVLDESLGLDDADVQIEEADNTLTDGELQPLQVEERVLRRYQQSLNKLLERGAEFVRSVDDPALSDLGFQAVLQLHERLTNLVVEVDGEPRELIARATLLQQKLELLDAYLRERLGTDPVCLATARVHLADCLSDPRAWTPLDWERLESIAHRFSRMLLGATQHSDAAARDAGIPLQDIDARLRPYSDRSTWEGFFIEVENKLDLRDFSDEPFPWATGEDWFDEPELSTAWEIVGYGAVVGFSTKTPYCVVAINANRNSPRSAHLLLCDPVQHSLHEAIQRRHDKHWLVRTYRGVSESTIGNFRRIRSSALEQAGCDRSSFEDTGTQSRDAIAEVLTAAGLVAGPLEGSVRDD